MEHFNELEPPVGGTAGLYFVSGLLRQVPTANTFDYATADKGSRESFREMARKLSDVPPERRAYVVAVDLSEAAKDVTVEAGSGVNVLRFVQERGFIADELAIPSGALPAGTAVFGEWTSSVLYFWQSALLVVDKVSKPGLVHITLVSNWNFRAERAADFCKLAEA